MFFKLFCKGSAVLCCLFVLVFLVLLLVGFLPLLQQVLLTDFLFGMSWHPDSPNPTFGIFPMVLTSLCAMAISLLIALPLALACGIWLLVFCSQRTRQQILTLLHLASCVPSVLWGFVFLCIVSPVMQDLTQLPYGTHFLTACCMLATMIFPLLCQLIIESLLSLPDAYLEGGLALGTSPTGVCISLLLPCAFQSIREAVLLCMGRLLGETTAVLMVSGGAVALPSFFQSVRFLTATIGGELPYATGLHRSALLGAGLVLMILMILISKPWKDVQR